MSGEMTSADSFNRFLLMATPELQPKSLDSTGKTKWDFYYTDGKNKNLKITYFLQKPVNANNSEKKVTLSHLEIRGDFNTLAKIYNKLFNENTAPKELEQLLPLRGPIYYGFSDYKWNKNNYWFSFANFEGEGYCMLFRNTDAK